MVDTVRTRVALQALLADNNSGNISAQDLRDMLASLDLTAESDTKINAKANKSIPSAENNVALLDASGNLSDSGKVIETDQVINSVVSRGSNAEIYTSGIYAQSSSPGLGSLILNASENETGAGANVSINAGNANEFIDNQGGNVLISAGTQTFEGVVWSNQASININAGTAFDNGAMPVTGGGDIVLNPGEGTDANGNVVISRGNLSLSNGGISITNGSFSVYDGSGTTINAVGGDVLIAGTLSSSNVNIKSGVSGSILLNNSVTNADTSGLFVPVKVVPTVNQTSGTGGLQALLIQPTVTAIGSSTSSAALWIQPTGSGATNLRSMVIKTAKTANVVEVQNSSGTTWFSISNSNSDATPVTNLKGTGSNNYITLYDNGALRFNTDFSFNYGGSNYQLLKLSNTEILVQNQTASTGVTKLTVKAGAGQSTTNLQECQDNSGNVVFQVQSTGLIRNTSGHRVSGGGIGAGNYADFTHDNVNAKIVISGGGTTGGGLSIEPSTNTDTGTATNLKAVTIARTYNQASGTPGGTDLKIVRTETAVLGTHR